MSESVVAVMAHPDDIEIHIAGTLCHLRAKGFALHLVTVCNGDCGSHKLSREEIAKVRAKEGAEAAELLGATYDCVGVGDLRLTDDTEVKSAIIDLLRKYSATIVITHSPKDYMNDHETTSMLTREACFAAPTPNWPSLQQRQPPRPLAAIPELYYADPTSQCDTEGKFVRMPLIVNVTSTMPQKRTLLACHKSQRDWLRDHHGEDNYIKTMEQWGRRRGQQVGFEFGEGLRQHLGYPFPNTTKLKDALPGLTRLG